MKTWNLLIVVAAVLLSAICLALPVAQWVSIPTDLTAKLLAGVAMLALGLCKLGFFPLAHHHLTRGRNFAGLCLLSFALLFLAINTDATRDLLTEHSTERQHLNQAGNQYRQQLLTQLDDLNREIATFNQLLAADSQNSYRERAYNQAESLQKLKQERRNLLAKLETTQKASQNATTERFGIGAGETVSDELVAAAALQIGCVLAVLACSAWAPVPVAESQDETEQEAQQKTIKPQPEKTEIAKPIKPVNQPVKATTKTELADDQKQLSRRIVAGEFGNSPSIKKLIEDKVIVGGHPKVKPVFDYLLATGDIKREGRFYQLTQTTIA